MTENNNDNEMFEEADILNDEDRLEEQENDGTASGDASEGADDGDIDVIKKLQEDLSKSAEELENGEADCGHEPDLLNALARERADFMNYKTRAQKEQLRMRDLGKQDALRALLPVLDEIERARTAGALEEGTPFANIAAKIEDSLAKLGVVKYGFKGDVFDPNLHEALMNRAPSEGENLQEHEVLVDQIIEPGYKLGEDVFRTAKVSTISNA